MQAQEKDRKRMQIVSKVTYSLLFHEDDLEEGYMFKKNKRTKGDDNDTPNKTQLECLLELKIVLTKK